MKASEQHLLPLSAFESKQWFLFTGWYTVKLPLVRRPMNATKMNIADAMAFVMMEEEV